MSGQPLHQLAFDETSPSLSQPPHVPDTVPPPLDEPQPIQDGPAQALASEDAQSSPSSNHPGLEQPSTAFDRLPVTADIEESQGNFSHEDAIEISKYFQNIREEEYERAKEEREQQSGEISLGHGDKQWNHSSSSESLPQVPPTTGLYKGVANPQFRSATALSPIAELIELSIDEVPPKMQSSPVVEYPKVSDDTSPTPIISLKAGIVCSADASCPPKRPVTEDDFVPPKRQFKPGYWADIKSFFHDNRVAEARKTGRPKATMRPRHRRSKRREGSAPLGNGELKQPDEAEGGNSGGLGGKSDEPKTRGSAAWESNNSHPIYAADEYVWG